MPKIIAPWALLRDGKPGDVTSFVKIDYDRIVMDHQMDIIYLKKIFFNSIDHFMGHQGINTVGQLHMNTGITSSRPVIMHDQIMDP